MVSPRPHGLGHERVHPVRPDHDACPLGHARSAPGVAADAAHPPVVEQDLVDGEGLAQLGARRHGGVHQQRVEHGAPRGEGARLAVDRPRGPGDAHGTEVELVGGHRRAARRLEPLEDAPAPERRHGRRVDEVRGHRVAGERGLVHQQHPVAGAGQQHRRRRSPAARPDHDCVVFVGHGRHGTGRRTGARIARINQLRAGRRGQF